MLAQGARAIAVSCRSPIHRAIGGWVTSGRFDGVAGRHRPINRAPTGGSVTADRAMTALVAAYSWRVLRCWATHSGSTRLISSFNGGSHGDREHAGGEVELVAPC